MSKKIIAVALVVICIALMFTACSDEQKLVKIKGREYLAMTDKDGNAVIDASNRLQAVVTDSNGEVVTFENGEPQTHWVPIDPYAVVDGKYYTPDFYLSSIKGWTFDTAGILFKDKSNNNCKIQISQVLDPKIPVAGTENAEEKEYIENPKFEDYIEYKDKVDAQALPEFEKQGYKVSHKKETVSLTAKKITMISYVSVIYDKDGNVFNYNETLYFKLDEKTWYSIQYNSARGEGYDEKFDFRAFVNENFQLIK